MEKAENQTISTDFSRESVIKSIQHIRDNCIAHEECKGCEILNECRAFRRKMPDEWLSDKRDWGEK